MWPVGYGIVTYSTTPRKLTPDTSPHLVATAHGPAGLFMYDDDNGTRVVMLMRPMAVEKTTAMSPFDNGGVVGFAWAQDGIGYSLVGGARSEILHPLADEMRRQISLT